jgi:hypothetical protein
MIPIITSVKILDEIERNSQLFHGIGHLQKPPAQNNMSQGYPRMPNTCIVVQMAKFLFQQGLERYKLYL